MTEDELAFLELLEQDVVKPLNDELFERIEKLKEKAETHD